MMRRMTVSRGFTLVAVLGLASLPFAGCGGDDSSVTSGGDGGVDQDSTTGADAQRVDGGAGDAGTHDSGAAETSTGVDSSVPDAGPTDANTSDIAVMQDANAFDAGTTDANLQDSAIADTGALDAGAADGGSICGDGVRESPEQCDDGNLVNLDGCDSTCRFEQDTRVIGASFVTTSTPSCANALGAAMTVAVQSKINTALATNIANGTTDILFKLFAITDLTGSSGSFSLGNYSGLPWYPYGAPYGPAVTGNNDVDWWYEADPSTVGSNNDPVAKMSTGSFAGGMLTAGGGHVSFPLPAIANPFGGILKLPVLDFANVSLQLSVDSVSAPTQSTTSRPAGHLPAEHDDPSLSSFTTAGGASASPTGTLCGNVTAVSLSVKPAGSPTTLPCNEGPYVDLLDAIVGGCTSFGVSIFVATQPDAINPDVPQPGTPPYTLTLSTTAPITVAGCTDHLGATMPLPACLAAAAYSSNVVLAMDRVMIAPKGHGCVGGGAQLYSQGCITNADCCADGCNGGGCCVGSGVGGLGVACTSGADCCTNNCGGAEGCCAGFGTGLSGTACTADGDCCSSNCGTASTCCLGSGAGQYGDACATSDDCCSTNCGTWWVTPTHGHGACCSGNGTAAYGAACTTGAECCSSYCGGALGCCVASGSQASGSACTTNADCCSGTCGQLTVGGPMVCCIGIGGANMLSGCMQNSDCCTGNCVSGQCQQ
jgi:hypothetical protein